MKKRFWTAMFGVLCASCFALGNTALASAEEVAYDAENVTDIVEYTSSTALMREGITFGGKGDVVFSRTAGSLLEGACGLSFSTKFASNAWKAKGNNQFRMTLGANEVYLTLSNAGALRIVVYNRARSVSTLGQSIKAVQIPVFDATVEHDWKLSRVPTSAAGDNGYMLTLTMDGNLVFEVAENEKVINSAYQTIALVNYTDVDVTVGSTFDKVLSFTEETNVLDVTEFNGDAAFLNLSGKVVKKGERVVAPLKTGDFTSANGGIQWKMKASQEWATSDEIFRLTLGALDVNLGYNAETNTVYTYSYANWSEDISLGGKAVIMENYDPTAWHTWKLTKAEATDGEGYAVRFYVDDAMALELYTKGELYTESTDGGVCFENVAGGEVVVRSAYRSRPVVEAREVLDLVEYGVSTDLLTSAGVSVASGESVLDYDGNDEGVYATDFFMGSAGVSFAFRSDSDWGAASAEQLVVNFGATKIALQSTGANSVLAIVSTTTNGFGEWSYEMPVGSFNEQAWHTVQIARRKFVRPLEDRGYQLELTLDGNRVELVMPMSLMWDENNQALKITNTSQGTLVFQSKYEGDFATSLASEREVELFRLGVIYGKFAQSNYSTANYAKITAIKTAYETKINTSTNVSEIKAYAYAARAEMEQVETLTASKSASNAQGTAALLQAESNTTPDNTTETSVGCKAVVGGTGLAIGMLTVAAVALLKKKED